MTTLETIHRVQRFRFASFDEAPPDVQAIKPEPLPMKILTHTGHAELPLPPVVPVITEQDLQEARAEARTQAYREGYGAAEAKMNKEAAVREDAVRSLLEVIANRITIAGEAHGVYLKEQQGVMEKLVLASARKVAGDALKHEPYSGVESLLKECLGLIVGEPKITIVTSPAYAAGLRQRIDTLRPMLQGFEGELIVAEEPALFDQDCRVEWSNGRAERTAEKLWADIEAVIARTPLNT